MRSNMVLALLFPAFAASLILANVSSGAKRLRFSALYGFSRLAVSSSPMFGFLRPWIYFAYSEPRGCHWKNLKRKLLQSLTLAHLYWIVNAGSAGTAIGFDRTGIRDRPSPRTCMAAAATARLALPTAN